MGLKHERVLVVSSVGGHLNQMQAIVNEILQKQPVEFHLCVNDATSHDLSRYKAVHQLMHLHRRVLMPLHLFEAVFFLLTIRPRTIVSAGAAPAFFFFLVGKFFGCKTIFVESFSRVKTPSDTGRMVRKLSDVFIAQHEGIKKFIPNAIIISPLNED